MQRTLKNRLKTVDLNVPKLVKLEDVTLLCLASSTRPRRRNLLAALGQYTVSHFRSSSTKSSSWFLSSLIIACRDANSIVFKRNTMNMKLSIWQRFMGTRDLDHLPSGNTEEVS